MSRSPRIALVDSARLQDGSMEYFVHHSSSTDPDLDHMLIVNIRHADESCGAFNNRNDCKHVLNLAEGGFDGKWRRHEFQRTANPRQADVDDQLLLSIMYHDFAETPVMVETLYSVADTKRFKSLKPTTWRNRINAMKKQGWVETYRVQLKSGKKEYTATHIIITEEGKDALLQPPVYEGSEMGEVTKSHVGHAGG